jgi:PleD family two-component response regulator
VSVGIALVAGHRSAAEVIGTADAALYDAKAGGKDRVEVRTRPSGPRSGGWRR